MTRPGTTRSATAVALVSALLAGPAWSAPPPPPPAKAVVEAVDGLIDADYVVAAMRPAIKAALATGLASGRYDGIDPPTLAERISDDLRAAAHDKHLGLRYDPAGAATLAKGEDSAAETASEAAFGHEHNEGISSLKVLDGNVRVMTYDGFMWNGAASKAAIDNAMAFLKGGDAAIIDLRNNGGGSPDASSYLASYFVGPGAKLVTFHLKNEPPTDSVSVTVQGPLLKGIPVYVLTSDHTASAAEEFVSHVARFRFARLVGSTTAGAAYRNDFYPVLGAYLASISIGRPELPGGGNWEGKGAPPDIAVPVPQALERAQAEALTALAEKASNPDQKKKDLWLAAAAMARLTPATPALSLASYAGRFGIRTITVTGDHLTFARDGGVTSALVPLEPNLFALDANPTVRLRFKTGAGGVEALQMEQLDGSVATLPRG